MRVPSPALVVLCVIAIPAAPKLGEAAVASPTPAAASPAPAVSASSEPADVVALRAKMLAAEGRRPNAERVAETTVRSDATERETTVRVGDDYRTSTGLGPFATSYGSFQGQDWHQNANGLTILDQDRAGQEARERRTTSLAHVTTPIVADVISELDPKRHGKRTFVDPATFRVVRIERITATETTVSTMDDFRTTDGYTRAWPRAKAMATPSTTPTIESSR